MHTCAHRFGTRFPSRQSSALLYGCLSWRHPPRSAPIGWVRQWRNLRNHYDGEASFSGLLWLSTMLHVFGQTSLWSHWSRGNLLWYERSAAHWKSPVRGAPPISHLGATRSSCKHLVWSMQVFQYLKRPSCFSVVSFDQCTCGAVARQPATLLLLRLPDVRMALYYTARWLWRMRSPAGDAWCPIMANKLTDPSTPPKPKFIPQDYMKSWARQCTVLRRSW